MLPENLIHVAIVDFLIFGCGPFDFNSDGAPDLLLQHDVAGQVDYREMIFLNNGVGVFTPLDNSLILDIIGLFFPLDADGDGGLDFIAWTYVTVEHDGLKSQDHDLKLLVHP